MIYSISSIFYNICINQTYKKKGPNMLSLVYTAQAFNQLKKLGNLFNILRITPKMHYQYLEYVKNNLEQTMTHLKVRYVYEICIYLEPDFKSSSTLKKTKSFVPVPNKLSLLTFLKESSSAKKESLERLRVCLVTPLLYSKTINALFQCKMDC